MCCVYVLFDLLQKSDFCVLEFDWTAADEIKLLDAIAQCGYGNWYVFLQTILNT